MLADFLITLRVCEGYVTAADLLTRVNEKSNFATDVSIRKAGIDVSTGSRYLEELWFEIVNEQSVKDITNKACDLTPAASDASSPSSLKTNEISEWSALRNEFVPMDKNGVFEDSLFIRPIVVRALLDAALAEAKVAKALDRMTIMQWPKLGIWRR